MTMINYKRNIYLIGFMGTGKSSVASYLSTAHNMHQTEMDDLLVLRAGCPISQIFREKGEEYFRDMETALLKETASRQGQIVSCGGGIITRQENISLMKSSGSIILLTASPDTIYARVGMDKGRPVLEGHRSPEGIRSLIEKRLPGYTQAADITISTDGREISDIGEEIYHTITGC